MKAGSREGLSLWTFFSACVVLVSCYHLSSSYVAGHFLPADHDSFYHGRRILDAIDAPLSVAQFDSHMHAPEGSWITWPWAYDAAMAEIAAVARRLGVLDPMSVLAWVAPVWSLVTTALLLGITRRLGLNLFFQGAVLACFAASPLTHLVHRVGMLDHHFIEYTFVLAVLYTGIRWTQAPTSMLWAVLTGALLGAAPAFHNGDFILQLPVVAMMAIIWLRAPEGLNPRAVMAFADALMAVTLVFLLPSIPFQQGVFDFALHSWFHFYIACITALIALALLRWSPTPRNVLMIMACGVVLTVPLLQQIRAGGEFVTGKIPGLAQMSEVVGPGHWLLTGAWREIVRFYSWLFFIAPFACGIVAWRAWQYKRADEGFVALLAVFGFVLLLQQQRLHYFGSFGLYLPLCMILNRETPSAWRRRATFYVLSAASILGMCLPTLPVLTARLPIGDDFQYMLTRAIYPRFSATCRKMPGIVLADQNDGHYIRYHTDCANIANNFILTRQHVEKNQLAERLLAGSLSAVREKASYVKYIYVRRGDNVLDSNNQCAAHPCPENIGLRQTLLFAPAPPDVKLLATLTLQRGTATEPLARLFEILPKVK